MPREFSRGKRVADQIQRELAVIIQRELRDPRVGMVTVNGVRVSRDLAYADVYVTAFGEEEATTSLEALEHASGFLRSRLATAISIRTLPKLRFHHDDTATEGQRVADLIDRAIAADTMNQHGEDEG